MKVKGRLCGKSVILSFENEEPLFVDQKLQILRDLLGDQFEYEEVSYFESEVDLLKEDVEIDKSSLTTNLNLKCSYLYDHIEHLANQLARTTARVQALETLLLSFFPETRSNIETLRDTLLVKF